jgi:cysteine synthase A
MIFDSALDVIGDTPLVRLKRIEQKYNLDGEIYAKVEYYSPGLSKKDRIAKYIIEKAIKEGKLKEGQTVIEQTSGNTGIGLALVCTILGYPFVAVMSKGNSVERVKMIEAFGGKVELVDKVSDGKGVSKEDMEMVEKRFKELTEELKAFPVSQFSNEDNAWAHYYTTGEEILRDLRAVDIFVDYVGTGGSFVGVSKRLKEANKCLCYKVVPDKINHEIQGGGYFKNIPFETENLCDGELVVSSEIAFEGMRELAREEGLYAGISSGANLKAAIDILKENPGKKVVFLLNDVGLKYLSVN